MSEYHKQNEKQDLQHPAEPAEAMTKDEGDVYMIKADDYGVYQAKAGMRIMQGEEQDHNNQEENKSNDSILTTNGARETADNFKKYQEYLKLTEQTINQNF